MHLFLESVVILWLADLILRPPMMKPKNSELPQIENLIART